MAKAKGMKPSAKRWHLKDSDMPDTWQGDDLVEGRVWPMGKEIEGKPARAHDITLADTGPSPPALSAQAEVILKPRIGHLAQDAASILYEGLKVLRRKMHEDGLSEAEWNRFCKLSDALVKLDKTEREGAREAREEIAKMDDVEARAVEMLMPQIEKMLIAKGWTPPGGE